jgi:hypothetical protein
MKNPPLRNQSAAREHSIDADVTRHALVLVSIVHTGYLLLALRHTALGLVGITLGALSVSGAWKRLEPRRHVPVLLALALAQGTGIVVGAFAATPPYPWRLLLVASLLGTTALATVLLLIRATRIRAADCVIAATSVWLAVLLAEVVAGARYRAFLTDRSFEWVGGETRDEHFFAPGTEARTLYPSNPRGYFSIDSDASRWKLDVHDSGSAATLIRAAGPAVGLRVEISRAGARVPWHIQLSRARIRVRTADTLLLTLRARADEPRSVSMGLHESREPWASIGFYRGVALDTAWRRFDYRFAVSTGAPADPVYSVTYTFNTMGCRSRDYPLAKEPGVRRILVLGDSYAMGFGVHAKDVFSSRLEQSLNDSARQTRYEVVNCALPGYGTRDERTLFETIGHRYRPDLVLVPVVWNDDHVLGQRPKAYTPTDLERLFALVHFARVTAYRRALPPHRYDSVIAELQELERRVTASGARLALVVFQNFRANEWEQLSAAIMLAFADTRVSVLHLGPAMLKRRDANLVVHRVYDRHPNEIAHAIAAREIEAFLARQRLLAP